MKKILTIILLLISSFCNAQRSRIIDPRLDEDIQSQKLETFLSADLNVDSTSKMQFAWVYIKVNKNKKIEFFKSSGTLNESFVKILEKNIHKKDVPWFKKNKNTTMWYVLPIVLGQVQSNIDENQVYWQILYNENNIYSLRELIRDYPGKVFILNTVRKLTNQNMLKIGL
jgi:hypothetical protein